MNKRRTAEQAEAGDDERSDLALLAGGAILALALVGCVVLFLVAG